MKFYNYTVVIEADEDTAKYIGHIPSVAGGIKNLKAR